MCLKSGELSWAWCKFYSKWWDTQQVSSRCWCLQCVATWHSVFPAGSLLAIVHTAYVTSRDFQWQNQLCIAFFHPTAATIVDFSRPMSAPYALIAACCLAGNQAAGQPASQPAITSPITSSLPDPPAPQPTRLPLVAWPPSALSSPLLSSSHRVAAQPSASSTHSHPLTRSLTYIIKYVIRLIRLISLKF